MLESIWFMIAALLIIIDIRDAIQNIDRSNSYIDQNRIKEAFKEMGWAVGRIVMAGVIYWASWYEVFGKACG
ncbi:TPA: hypothetical protein NNT57_004649 [Salmonella enterica]|nr:hypothetical protein [Salmonella enterica]HCH9143105.1 hypothetical protein [Salmonella enterica]